MNNQGNIAPQEQYNELPAPPRFLLWLVIGIFILAIIGGISGILVFRHVLQPGQQQRVIGILPFMSAFVIRVAPDTTVPTVVPPENSIDPDLLLSGPLFASTEESTPEVTPTEISMVVPPTSTPLPTETLTPTALPTQTPLPTETGFVMPDLSGVSIAQAESLPQQADPLPVSTSPRIPTSHRLYGITHVTQTWNNCGPANITMALSFYSWRGDQQEAASYLKPDREDKNVSPQEMVSFVNENTGVGALVRYGGDVELIKRFIAAEFPVIIETGYMLEGTDWLGHYQTVVGYDDNQQLIYLYDSNLGTGGGAGVAERYDDFDSNWQAFNRLFIVIYLKDREAEVRNILGERADSTRAAELALEVARREAQENPQNEFAWFNMGTSYNRLGMYEEAAAAYDRAINLGLNFRMLWYQFGPYEAYYQAGRYSDIIGLAASSLNSTQYVEETHYWQGRALEALGQTGEAADAYRRALTHNSRFAAAQTALNQLGG